MELEVTGKFPPQVAGTLYRTGPSHYKVDTENGEFALSHWFDGFTQIYRFKLVADDNGGCRVYYSSRRQTDELVDQVRKTGSLDGIITFGQQRDPCMSLFQKVKSVFRPTGLGKSPGFSNVGATITANMPGMPKNRLTGLTDNTQIKLSDLETLEPVGVTDQSSLHPSLKVRDFSAILA